MELLKDIPELVSACVGIGGLLAAVAWTVGSVIHLLINVMKKG